jgi:XRE family transcriptional regulator, regulator of sulfur utilization
MTMITRRDVVVAMLAMGLTLGVVAMADQHTSAMQSAVFDWNSIPAKSTDVGSVREFFDSPTVTLEQLELHATTLNPGKASEPPHRHPDEELVIVKEGKLEALVNGEWKSVGPGSVMFEASNQLHGLRNGGSVPVTYHVIEWRSSSTPKADDGARNQRPGQK